MRKAHPAALSLQSPRPFREPTRRGAQPVVPRRNPKPSLPCPHSPLAALKPSRPSPPPPPPPPSRPRAHPLRSISGEEGGRRDEMDSPTNTDPLPDGCNVEADSLRQMHGSTSTSASTGRWGSPFVEKLLRVFSPPARPTGSGSTRSQNAWNGSFMIGTMPIDLSSYAGITPLSLNEDDRSSLSAKVEDWLIEKGLELFLENFLPPFVPRLFVPTLRTVETNSQQILDLLQKISRTASSIEVNSAEAVRLLQEIASAASTAENQVKDGVREVKEAAGNDPQKPLPESVKSDFIKKLRAVNSGPFSEFLKELEKIGAMAAVPVNLKKQLTELKLQVQQFPWMITSFVSLLGGAGNKVLAKPDPSKEKPSLPDSPSPLPRPTPAVPTTLPPVPFSKFGKRAADVLYGGYVENPLHAEVMCGFKLGTQTFPARIGNAGPSVLMKIRSSPEFSLLMSHKKLFGDGVKGAVSFVLPFGTTSLANVQYLNEKFSLNAEMGLHLNPSTKIAASYKHEDLCVGGAVTFGARDGRITGAEAGICASNPEWGILSGQAKLVRNPDNGVVNGRAVKILYSQDFMGKNTIAAHVDYNYDDNTIFITGGVEHRVDDSMLLKARVRTDGTVACMVQFKEGMAGSTFRAMVQANVHALNEQPRVGFSISSDPTK